MNLSSALVATTLSFKNLLCDGLVVLWKEDCSECHCLRWGRYWFVATWESKCNFWGDTSCLPETSKRFFKLLPCQNFLKNSWYMQSEVTFSLDFHQTQSLLAWGVFWSSVACCLTAWHFWIIMALQVMCWCPALKFGIFGVRIEVWGYFRPSDA